MAFTSKKIYPVILAGGSGTRLWPLSRTRYPKQFIELIDKRSLFQNTCRRFSSRTLFGPLTIVTHEEYRFLVRDQLRAIGITDAYVITEPEAKNTAPACMTAGLFLQKHLGNVPILFTPADHSVQDDTILYKTLGEALPVIEKGSMCVFGIPPNRPHTGYGYILRGEQLTNHVYNVRSFEEKPNKEGAIALIERGALWNMGLYFSMTGTLIKEGEHYTPFLIKQLRDITTIKKNQHGFYMIPKELYSKVVSESIDTAIAEKSKHMIIAETPIHWNDVGSWAALYKDFEKDSLGNVARGNSVLIKSTNSYIESRSRLVTAFGLDNVGIIETTDAVLVFPIHESENIKEVVAALSKEERQELTHHTNVHRPWGMYEILGGGQGYQSKRITVFPGEELSLQRHLHRAEHWIITNGVATVTIDNVVFEIKQDESIFIPRGSTHRLKNNHHTELHLIEVQTGDYFGENDIERLEDNYGRE
jgi:mannose-1-phosphate guanylyltransferase/mannose-6-phosphate isomerase